MATTCFQCHRGALNGVSRSHSNIATKRKQYINLQRKKINGKRVYVCTRCIRSQSHV